MKELTPITTRTKLIEKLPLDTPFGIHICPSTYCNFKCVYCKHGSKQEDLGFEKKLMQMECYEKIINQIKDFPAKLKLLNFAWLGEPLLNPHIAQMVELAKKADIAERVEIVSNASMLTKELARNLVNAGLDRIRISIQALDESGYEMMSNYNIDYARFVDNIKYMHEYSLKMGGGTYKNIYKNYGCNVARKG